MVLDVNGKRIDVKEYGCRMGDIPARKVIPSVNIFTKVTGGCPAGCLFCSNAGAEHVSSNYDIDKLAAFSEELMAAGVEVHRLNITGGEPSLVPDRVRKILERFSQGPLAGVHLHLNTNGLLPASQQLMRHPRWDSISVSLHHYDKDKLSEIYGIRIPDGALDFTGIDMNILNVSCNLLKGYIDSADQVHRMLDLCIDKGITRIGFVSLMQVNDWCREHFVDFKDIDLESIPHVYFTRCMDRGTDCKCSNYLYNRDMKVLEIYNRHYANYHYCESSLVYDGEYFRQGFHTDNIVY